MVELRADAGAQGAELPEILRRTGHVEHASRGDLPLVHLRYAAAVEPQFVIQHRAGGFAREVEVDVVGQVYRRRAVGAGQVGDLQRIVVVEVEDRLHVQFARIALVAVVREQIHHDAVGLRAAFPYAVGEALRAAVQVVAVVVAFEPVFLSVDRHAAVGYAVGNAAHALAAGGAVAEVAFGAAVAQRHVGHAPFAVGHRHGHDGCAVVGQFYFGALCVAQGVEDDGLALGRHAPQILLDLDHASAGCSVSNIRSMRRRHSSLPMNAVTSYMPGPLPAPTSARRSVFMTWPMP